MWAPTDRINIDGLFDRDRSIMATKKARKHLLVEKI